MTFIPNVAPGHRRRTFAEVESALQDAIRTLAGQAAGARLTGHPIDRTALRNTLEGLRRLLVEPVGDSK